MSPWGQGPGDGDLRAVECLLLEVTSWQETLLLQTIRKKCNLLIMDETPNYFKGVQDNSG